MSDNKPAKQFRIGFITATVWANDGTDRTFYSVEVSRTYKDGDQWKSSSSLNHSDLLNAVKVLERAEVWIAKELAS